MVFSGLLPLFILAHFGHHVAGAMLSPLMPMIKDDLRLSYTEAGLLTAAFSVTGGLVQLPAGWLADRVGNRLMILVAISGVAAGGLLVGLSRSYMGMLAFLVLTALLAGGYHPASAAAISSFVPPERRGRAMGLHLIGGTSSMLLVPLIAAPIAVAWSWHTPYIVLTVPVIALGFVIYFLLGRQAKMSSGSATTAPNMAGPSRINWRILVPFLGLSVGTTMVTQSVAGYYSLYAVDQLGIAKGTAAVLMSITPAVGAVVAPFSGGLADRFGGATMLTIAGLLAAPTVLSLNLVSDLGGLAAVLAAGGLVNMLCAPAAESFLLTNVPERRRATVMGFYFFAGSGLGGLLTLAVGRVIDEPRFGFAYAFGAAAVLQVTLAIGCAIALRRATVRARQQAA
jgi:MFS family permease